MHRTFQHLKELEPLLTPLNFPPLPQWMLDQSMWMIDKRTYLCRNPRHNRNVARNLTKVVWRSPLVDFRWREEKAEDDIGKCLEPTKGGTVVRGLYTVFKRWYHHASARAPNPSRLDMSKVTG